MNEPYFNKFLPNACWHFLIFWFKAVLKASAGDEFVINEHLLHMPNGFALVDDFDVGGVWGFKC